MTTPAKTGAHGWPLVLSTYFKGETVISCPLCGSQDVLMSVAYPARGTGPGGRGRLGDAGSAEYAQCRACNHRSDGRQS